MKVNSIHRIVSVILLLILPSTLCMADSNNAMLNANGRATINGSQAPGSSAIFPGDMIETLKHSTAIIASGGTTVNLSAESLVVYQANGIELTEGGAVITTNKVTTGRVADLSITPVSSDSTKFGLANHGGTKTIAAIEGSLRVTDGSHTVVLQPGQALTRGPNAQQDASSQASNPQGQASANDASEKEKKKKRREGPVPAAQAGIFGSIPNWEIIALIAGVAFAPFAGLWIYDEVTEPASPSKP